VIECGSGGRDGRPGGGSAASPSAARSRRTACGSVTAPRTAVGPRSAHRPAPGWRTPGGARGPSSAASLTASPRCPRSRRQGPDEGRSPHAIERAGPASRGSQQRPARRGHQGGEPRQQLERVQEERRRAVAPRPLWRVRNMVELAEAHARGGEAEKGLVVVREAQTVIRRIGLRSHRGTTRLCEGRPAARASGRIARSQGRRAPS
jgi:hypothetical protein